MVAEVRIQHEVVNEIAMPVVYLKMVRDGKKQVFMYTDRRFHQVSAEPHIRE